MNERLEKSLLNAGRNCWRVEPARRVSFIIDGSKYFRAAKEAMHRAQNSILIIGWDFDPRTGLERDGNEPVVPDNMGALLRELVRTRPDLEIRVLKWNLALLTAIGRGIAPFFLRNWRTSGRLHFRLDSNHPPGACHHQKILVVDDGVAFCGGIDFASNRWDTRAHLDGDPHRRLPGGRPYTAHHDVMMAVDGIAAAALGDLARERWWHATGERLDAPPREGDPWPAEALPRPDLRDVDVAIARTVPKHDGRPEIREIERLQLDAIAAARDTIYIENQYIAPAGHIFDCLAARLAEPDGPELVIVSARRSSSWLERQTMDAARDLAVQKLREADANQRFRVYAPLTDGGEDIIVHSKCMVIDDRLVRIGSANLNHRSMGFDTECDLALESPPRIEGERVRRAIRAYRDDLLAEHLHVPVHRLSAKIENCGSLVRAIEALRAESTTARGRLQELPPTRVSGWEGLAENRLTDPARPEPAERTSKLFFESGRRHLMPF